jgi:hypothetical protein
MSKYYNPENESVGVLGDGLHGLGSGVSSAPLLKGLASSPLGFEIRTEFDKNFLSKYNNMALNANYTENFVIPDYRTPFDKKYLNKYDKLALNKKY